MDTTEMQARYGTIPARGQPRLDNPNNGRVVVQQYLWQLRTFTVVQRLSFAQGLEEIAVEKKSICTRFSRKRRLLERQLSEGTPQRDAPTPPPQPARQGTCRFQC